MKLTTKAVELIRKSQRTKLLLALSLGVSERWIIACLKNNEEDGLLTKATALKVIKRELGIKETEILTQSVQVGL